MDQGKCPSQSIKGVSKIHLLFLSFSISYYNLYLKKINITLQTNNKLHKDHCTLLPQGQLLDDRGEIQGNSWIKVK